MRILATLVFALSFLAGGSARAQVSADSRGTVATSSGDGGHMQWIQSDDDSKLEVESEGVVKFLDDDSGVRSISPGGYLRIRLSEGRRDVALDIRSDKSGELSFGFRRNGREAAYDAEARREMAPLFLRIVRETGLYVDERVARFLAAGGPDAVFEEIGEIRSSSAVHRYLTSLISQATLDDDGLIRAADMARDRIRSSGDLSRFLKHAAADFLAAPRARPAYFTAVRAVKSSGDKARTLIHLLEFDSDVQTMRLVLDTAVGISSSGDKSRVLIAAAPHYNGDSTERDLLFAAISTISSSGDHARTLLALIDRGDLSEATILAVIKSTEGIASSGDASRVLVAVAPHVTGDSLAEAYLEAAKSVGSSGDRSRVLTAIMDQR